MTCQSASSQQPVWMYCAVPVHCILLVRLRYWGNRLSKYSSTIAKLWHLLPKATSVLSSAGAWPLMMYTEAWVSVTICSSSGNGFGKDFVICSENAHCTYWVTTASILFCCLLGGCAEDAHLLCMHSTLAWLVLPFTSSCACQSKDLCNVFEEYDIQDGQKTLPRGEWRSGDTMIYSL